MLDKKRELLQRWIKVLNVIGMIVPFAAAWICFFRELGTWQTEVLLLLCASLIYIIFGHVYEAFQLAVTHVVKLIYSQMLTAFVTDFFCFLIIWMVLGSFPNPTSMLLVLAVQFVVSAVWSFCAHKWYFSFCMPKRVLAVTSSAEAVARLEQMDGFSQRFQLVDSVPVGDVLADPDGRLQNIDVVFLLQTPSAWEIMQLCAFRNITVYRVPLVSEIFASRSKAVNLFHTPMLRMDGYQPNLEYLFVKRCMDIVLSGTALLITAPIMLFVAVAIKRYDGGPVFYRQQRLTQGGKVFSVLKFRSMRVDAEKDGVARLSSGDADDRITPVGRWIRKLRIDELPQLINILKGDMSIVGPRPERPELTEEYAKVMPEFRLRLLAKAGLTGYAQVYGKYNTTPDDKLRMDLMYLLRPSLAEDLRIMFATVKILFLPESTEGVAEGARTAMEINPVKK